MRIFLLLTFTVLTTFFLVGFAQTNDWVTGYVTDDDASNGTGYQTSSVAATGPDRFVALVTETPNSLAPADLFNPPGNYLVGYYEADSSSGRVPSPIGGQQTAPQYGTTGQYSAWEYILDQVQLKGAWQMASDEDGYVYVANNDDAHNILVFQLTGLELIASEYRMETGTEYIYGIELDTAGYVYVVDYEGTDAKIDEVKVYAGINDPNTSWGTFGGHNDLPVATIDLPAGFYQGITVSSDGTEIFVSATSERSILKFTGDPVNGYSEDLTFSYTLAAYDTISNGGYGTPSVLGLGYMMDPPLLFAAVDSFIHIGGTGGYPYGRIYVINPEFGWSLDTIDVAEWNFLITGSYSNKVNGRASGYTSVCDVDVEASEQALYTQSYYGWTADKWVFDGDLNAAMTLEQVSVQVPDAYDLKQNYPNPFNPLTIIEFEVREAGVVQLDIINVMGQKVATLVNEQMGAGSYQVTFDAGNLPSGIYFYRMTAGNYNVIKKMTLMK